MATDRYDLPPASDGREQFAMIERRPDRAQMKEIERRSRQAARTDTTADADDWLIVTLCSEWTVYDRDGQPVPLRTGAGMDKVPAHTTAPLIDELEGIVASVSQGKALREIGSALRNMSFSLGPDDAERLNGIIEDLNRMFGVTPPNGTSQA